MKLKRKFSTVIYIFLFIALILFSACKNSKNSENTKKSEAIQSHQQELQSLLDSQNFNGKQKYSLIKQIADTLRDEKDYQGLILFLTDWVDKNPDDMYNSYWLLMTADAYLAQGAEPVAEYYFDRILQQCQDLLVKGNSVHFICLQNLIQITSEN